MRIKATVTSKGQVTIPIEIRRRLGLEQGDTVDFVVEDGVTYLQPARAGDNPFESYVGALGTLQSADEARDWVRSMRDDD